MDVRGDGEANSSLNLNICGADGEWGTTPFPILSFTNSASNLDWLP